ncbi:MAG TPA: hypothetical protein DCE55_04580 [Planctomycetaceae bacterium]|nr:hypothetical protein [Planctomycetaceae bacterium]
MLRFDWNTVSPGRNRPAALTTTVSPVDPCTSSTLVSRRTQNEQANDGHQELQAIRYAATPRRTSASLYAMATVLRHTHRMGEPTATASDRLPANGESSAERAIRDEPNSSDRGPFGNPRRRRRKPGCLPQHSGVRRSGSRYFSGP